jgi:hypothetical protein
MVANNRLPREMGNLKFINLEMPRERNEIQRVEVKRSIVKVGKT